MIAAAPPCARLLGEYLVASATPHPGSPWFRFGTAPSNKMGAGVIGYESRRDHPWDAPTLILVRTSGKLSEEQMQAQFVALGGRQFSSYGSILAVVVPANVFGCVADMEFVLNFDLPTPVYPQ
jgi:hypothetical protein